MVRAKFRKAKESAPCLLRTGPVGGPRRRQTWRVGTPAAAPSPARSPASGIGSVTERSPTRGEPSKRHLSRGSSPPYPLHPRLSATAASPPESGRASFEPPSPSPSGGGGPVVQVGLRLTPRSLRPPRARPGQQTGPLAGLASGHRLTGRPQTTRSCACAEPPRLLVHRPLGTLPPR